MVIGKPPPSRINVAVTPADKLDEKGSYFVTLVSEKECTMKFGGVLFQVGTNKFLDLVPMIEACDYIPANPPSLIELLQATTLLRLHLVLKVNPGVKELQFGFIAPDKLQAAVKKGLEYFSTKTSDFPRMVPDPKRQREFLLRFGNDTNLFRMGTAKKISNRER